jgi:UDP-2-acetamido-3-amino-2,3-dideoxy-glucuronate N-acetyltransferase
MELGFYAHPSAFIDQPCRVGRGTRIGHFCHVVANATIGSHCTLGHNVHVAADVVIGNNVEIQNNVSLYTGVVIEEDTFLGPSCVFTNLNNPRASRGRTMAFEKTRVRRGATIGANATILCGTTIGQYAFVAAGAVVTADVPDYALVMGVPAQQVGWMSRHGHRLGPPSPIGIFICPHSKWRYRIENGILRCLDCPEEKALPAAA